jgi:hypothetical protein
MVGPWRQSSPSLSGDRDWLDAFRLTLPGGLLLGRIFSAWNMLAYGVGIIFAVGLDRMTVDALAVRLRGHAGAR